MKTTQRAVANTMSEDQLDAVVGGFLPLIGAVAAGIAISGAIVHTVSNYPGSDTQKAVDRAGKLVSNPLGAAIDAATPGAD